jgi:hypothetical protein
MCWLTTGMFGLAGCPSIGGAPRSWPRLHRRWERCKAVLRRLFGASNRSISRDGRDSSDPGLTRAIARTRQRSSHAGKRPRQTRPFGRAKRACAGAGAGRATSTALACRLSAGLGRRPILAVGIAACVRRMVGCSGRRQKCAGRVRLRAGALSVGSGFAPSARRGEAHRDCLVLGLEEFVERAAGRGAAPSSRTCAQ